VTLVVFDLDGTLLNKQSEISAYTADTLAMMRSRGIAYTVATGRTLASGGGPAQRPSLCVTDDFKEWGHYLVPR
jgi:beta-phosphoglucomutase-like phosphatase (HAD superfamily)